MTQPLRLLAWTAAVSDESAPRTATLPRGRPEVAHAENARDCNGARRDTQPTAAHTRGAARPNKRQQNGNHGIGHGERQWCKRIGHRRIPKGAGLRDERQETPSRVTCGGISTRCRVPATATSTSAARIPATWSITALHPCDLRAACGGSCAERILPWNDTNGRARLVPQRL
jgi:hypothetical protein